MRHEAADVPCNGCTLCCVHQAVLLMPEDDATQYDWVQRGGVRMLREKADGSCIYLGEGGCTIHERAPVMCKVFDCRRAYAVVPRAERRRRVAQGLASAAIYEAGRKRLGSLERGWGL